MLQPVQPPYDIREWRAQPFPVRIRMQAGALRGGHEIEIEATSRETGKKLASGESRFIAP